MTRTRPKFPRKASVRGKVRKKHPKVAIPQTIVVCGFDVSMTSICGAAMAYDKTLKKQRGPVFTECRWNKGTHYFKRMEDAARGHLLVQDMIGALGAFPDIGQIHIAIEEPWSFGHVGKGASNTLKQQAQISGAFMGALLRWGYLNVYEIHNVWWRGVVANDLGITIHHTKWNPTKQEGKFRAKQWALEYKTEWKVPEWPDLIQDSKLGLIPRPEGRKAKATQSDDRYEALAMMQWLWQEELKLP